MHSTEKVKGHSRGVWREVHVDGRDPKVVDERSVVRPRPQGIHLPIEGVGNGGVGLWVRHFLEDLKQRLSQARRPRDPKIGAAHPNIHVEVPELLQCVNGSPIVTYFAKMNRNETMQIGATVDQG